MMEQLAGSVIANNLFSDLEWVRDLFSFDGPLLSEFRNQDETYLFHWCDCDESTDRWMVIPIDEKDRVRLVVGDVTLREVIHNSCRTHAFFTDRNDDGSEIFQIVSGKQIPKDYLPHPNSKTEIDNPHLALNDGIASVLMRDSWNLENLREFVRKYSQIYHFKVGLKNKSIRRIPKLELTNGFSAMHFYKQLDKQIHHSDKLSEESIQAASPGLLNLNVDKDIAHEIIDSLARYGKNKQIIDEKYNALHSEVGTDDFGIEMSELFAEDSDLRAECEVFVNSIYGVNGERYYEEISKNRSHFEAVKIVFADFRRLRDLHRLLRAGHISLARWELLAKTA